MSLCTATFETGVNGATISVGDAGSATPWDSVTGAPTYSNTHSYGALAMKVTDVTMRCNWSTALGTVTEHYGRAYFYLEGNPALAYQIIRAYDGGSLAATLVFIDSTGKLVIGDSLTALGTSTNSVALNQWVRAEYHVIHSTTVGFVEARLFNDPDSTTPTEILMSDTDNNTRAQCTNVRVGSDTNDSVGNRWIDNVVVGAASYPGPVVSSTQILVPHMLARTGFH